MPQWQQQHERCLPPLTFAVESVRHVRQLPDPKTVCLHELLFLIAAPDSISLVISRIMFYVQREHLFLLLRSSLRRRPPPMLLERWHNLGACHAREVVRQHTVREQQCLLKPLVRFLLPA